MNPLVKISVAIFFFFNLLNSQAQNDYRDLFSYISPQPDAKFVMLEQKISFRLQEQFSEEELLNIKVYLVGSVSGKIDGEVILASDRKTVIFNPTKGYSMNELVEVFIDFPISLNLDDFSTSFTTTSLPANERKKVLHELLEQETSFDQALPQKLSENINSLKIKNDSLPFGFPEITITHWNAPSDGYIFVAPLNYDDNIYFQIILDNYATPVFYRDFPAWGALDFKLQPNGYLTTFLTSERKFIVQDSNFVTIDTIEGQNGYTTDIHELRYYEDMHSFLLCYDPQLVDMSQIVPGGQQDAIVTGLIVQELDENKEVVFQWRSWDHYQITDASNWIDLTASMIDYVHGNSIEIISEDEMLICSRNMNEITKLDRNTGDIIWRLNGENNMFDFVEPADSFCVQHSIRLMPDSANISLFDNGSCWNPQYSSAVEYILDEENYTCTLVERLRSDPDIHGPYMGNTQRMLNGHTINGWGKGIPSVTEFDELGNIRLQFSFPHLNYRAFKYDWQHTVFSTNTDEISFEGTLVSNSSNEIITLSNNTSSDILINQVLNHNNVFSILNDLPILLPAGGNAEVQINFLPDTIAVFDDLMTFCWDINSDTLNQRIAVQVKLTGLAYGYEGVEELKDAGFIVYPSPFEDFIVIESKMKIIEEVMIFNLNGKEVFKEENIRSKTQRVPLDLPSRAYLLRIKTMDEKYYSGKIIRK